MDHTSAEFQDLVGRSSIGRPLSQKERGVPERYLGYARDDFEGGQDARHLVNSFANAKRALHCRVETLIRALGVPKLKERKYEHFPAQIEVLQKCGIVSPSILGRINKIRNKLEHEYQVPSREDTETCLDVVELFLAATDKLIKSFPEQVQLADDMEGEEVDTRILGIVCEHGAGVLHVSWKCIEVSKAEFAKAVRKEVARIKKQKELSQTEKMRVDVKGIRRTAHDAVFALLAEHGSRSVSIKDIDEFCSWVKVMLKAA